jgi:hypothetical protein
VGNLAQTIDKISTSLQVLAGNGSVILTGKNLDCLEVDDLLESLSATELRLDSADVTKAPDSASVEGPTSLFGVAGVTARLTFAALRADALSVGLRAKFPKEARLHVPGLENLEWASIRDLFLEARVFGPSLVPITSINFGGNVVINGTPIAVTISQSLSPSGWLLRIAGIPIAGPSVVAKLLGVNSEDIQLPEPIANLGGFSMELLGYIRSDWTVLSLGATVETEKQWPIAKDFDIDGVRLSIRVDREGTGEFDDPSDFEEPLDASKLGELKRVSASLAANLRVSALTPPLVLPVRILYGGDELRIGILNAHGFPSLGALADAVAHKSVAGSLPGALRRLRLEEVSLEVTVSTKGSGFRSFFLNARLEDLAIVTGKLALARMAIELNVEDKWVSGFASGAIRLGEIEIMLFARRSVSGGWEFKGNTAPDQRTTIKTLIETVAGLFNDKALTLPPVLESFTLDNFAVAFTTETETGSFWLTCAGTIPFGDRSEDKLSAKVDIRRENDEFGFSGELVVAEAAFAFVVDLKKDSGTEISAHWESAKSKTKLNLTTLSKDLSLPPALQSLAPDSAELTLSLSKRKKRLALACAFSNGARAAFLLGQNSDASKPGWYAAFGMKPGDISTKSLGPLGSALKPHAIALKGLEIVAATANVSEAMSGFQGPIAQGLLLKGVLEFEGTSFREDFECQLGGTKQKERGEPSPAHDAARIPEVNASGTLKLPEGKNNVPVGRTIGPITFRKARFESRKDPAKPEDDLVCLLFDASMAAGGLELSLDGFALAFPQKAIFDPKSLSVRVDLDGLAVNFSRPPLTIGGGLRRTPNREGFEGDLLIQAERFQIAAIGSYSKIRLPTADGSKTIEVPSLFVFGMLAGMLGGPPPFFVTGLALGAGYNSRLTIPPVEEIEAFPLVAAVADPTKFSEARAGIGKFIAASYGDYWLAAGVKFTSFRLADSFALFSVAFGNRLQFALTGLTKLSLPPEVNPPTTYAELAIRAVLDPQAGVLGIEGRLTKNSYIFATELRLTGGFAFFVWFGGAKEAGDFVITLGGYHPRFVKPQHYPNVPRLGIRGQLGDSLSVAGEAYLAITPSCLMTGLKFEATYASKDGALRVAFLAYADFLIAWAPFHYEAEVGIAISVFYQPFHNDVSGASQAIKLECSAILAIAGPPFGGVATINVLGAPLRIEFGLPTSEPKRLKWDEFRKQFLQSNSEGQPLLAAVRIAGGIIREIKDDKGKLQHRIVNPYELAIETDSTVPCSTVGVGNKKCGTVVVGKESARVRIGVRPMGWRTLESSHTVKIWGVPIGSNKEDDYSDQFTVVSWSQKSFPDALWSPTESPGEPRGGELTTACSGAVLRVTPTKPIHGVGPFAVKSFLYGRGIPKKIAIKIGALRWTKQTAQKLSESLEDQKIRMRREEILERLLKLRPAGARPWSNTGLGRTASDFDQIFQAKPQWASIGAPL